MEIIKAKLVFVSYIWAVYLCLFFALGLAGRAVFAEPIDFSGNRFVYTKEKAPDRYGRERVQTVIQIIGNARVVRGSQILRAYRIKVIGDDMEHAYAHGHVRLYDRKDKVLLKGQYAEYHRKGKDDSVAKVTKQPVLIYSHKASRPGTKEGKAKNREWHDGESFRLYVHGKAFVRHDKAQKIEITGPVQFKKSNELVHGTSRRARYDLAQKMLFLQGDCSFVRGDDRYRAQKIRFFSGERKLILQEKVHLIFYNYELDPLAQGYQPPWQQQKSASDPNGDFGSAPQREGERNPFRLRKYSVLSKVKPDTPRRRYQLRQFLLSRVDFWGEHIHYDRRKSAQGVVTAKTPAFWSSREGILRADYMRYVRGQKGYLLARGNLFGERYEDASFYFGQRLRYQPGPERVRLAGRAHILLLDPEKDQPNTQGLDFVSLRGESIERYGVGAEARTRLTERVRLVRGDQRIRGHWAVYYSQSQRAHFVSQATIERSNSTMKVMDLSVDLDSKSGSLYRMRRGLFFDKSERRDDEQGLPSWLWRTVPQQSAKLLDSGADVRRWFHWHR